MDTCKNCKRGICHKTCCGFKTYECSLGHVAPKTHFEPVGYGHGGVAIDEPGHILPVAGDQSACLCFAKRQ